MVVLTLTNEPEEATDLLFFFLNCNEKNRKRSGKQKYEEFKRRVFFLKKKSVGNYYYTDSRKLILNGATLYTHLQFLTSTCTVFRVVILFRILCCYALLTAESLGWNLQLR